MPGLKLSLSIGYWHSEDSKTPISPTISLLLQTDSPSQYWFKWHLSAFSNKALLQSIHSPWQQNMLKIQGYEHGLYHACIAFQMQNAKTPVRWILMYGFGERHKYANLKLSHLSNVSSHTGCTWAAKIVTSVLSVCVLCDVIRHDSLPQAIFNEISTRPT